MEPGSDDAQAGRLSGELAAEVVAAHEEAVRAGRDWYPDPATGFMVLTAEFLAAQGRCCGSGCRHCPYGTDERDAQ